MTDSVNKFDFTHAYFSIFLPFVFDDLQDMRDMLAMRRRE